MLDDLSIHEELLSNHAVVIPDEEDRKEDTFSLELFLASLPVCSVCRDCVVSTTPFVCCECLSAGVI